MGGKGYLVIQKQEIYMLKMVVTGTYTTYLGHSHNNIIYGVSKVVTVTETSNIYA